ncbi:MAG TPA: DUF11 domain-containing protein, partial [Methanoregula sp.]|nr:DUF11 domain-containing protein [Methanoregula sp.]
AEDMANLSVWKIVSSPGPYEQGQPVSWTVTVMNNGPATATNISLSESISGFTGLESMNGVADQGTYDNSTRIWTIGSLDNATSARLTVTTVFDTEGTQTNAVDLLGLDQTNNGDNHAEAAVVIAGESEDEASLSLWKIVSSTGPYEQGQPVSWTVTVLNNGPANATNVTLYENSTGCTGLESMSGVADLGTYDNSTRIWTISSLDNATSAHLMVTTVLDAEGTQTNAVDILGLDQTNNGDNHAEAAVVINNTSAVIPPEVSDEPVSGNISIRPATLNLNSRGVFTVFVTLDGGNSTGKPRIDFSDSSLVCDGAEMIRAGVSNKAGGTLVAKFHRQDLENVTNGTGVLITCSGLISVNGELVVVEGSDTIRVIGEKQGLDKILSGFMKYLGLEKDEDGDDENEEGTITTTVTLNPDAYRNNGQMKKAIRTADSSDPEQSGTAQNVSGKAGAGNPKTEKTTGNDKKIQETSGNAQKMKENNAGNNEDKGNKNSNKGADASNGKSNGKKNK